MLIPVVLSGGAGTRLWPVSREGHPKPFIRLSDGDTLLEKTFKRAAACEDVKEVVTITNRDYYFQTKDAWATASIRPDVKAGYLLEPVGRNTAPAILLGALAVRATYGDDAVLLVLPADHLVRDVSAFARDVKAATRLARAGYLVTFGIPPLRPETGFGYINGGAPIENAPGRLVRGFIEKPNIERATELLNSGDCYWNSGMFCFKASHLVEAFEQHAPRLLQQAQACFDGSIANRADTYLEFAQSGFAELEDISIDYAIMEKAANVAIVPASFDWSDIGSWNALAELVSPDDAGNRTHGDVVNVGSSNCFIQSEGRIVAAIGLEDLIVVDTPDALLVSRRDRAQDVKEVVKQLKASGDDTYRWHRTVRRPWGSFTVLEEASRYKIKRIEVKPGASLSLQMHHHRSEHWIVVTGVAKVVNGDREFLVNANESTYIPAGHKHRLENPGLIDLVMIEVQSGEYLGEDDIVRFEDVYGRSSRT